MQDSTQASTARTNTRRARATSVAPAPATSGVSIDSGAGDGSPPASPPTNPISMEGRRHRRRRTGSIGTSAPASLPLRRNGSGCRRFRFACARIAARDRPQGPRPVPQPRAHLARIQPPRAERGRRRANAAPRAREVPRHRQLEPRRVLHEAHRRPETAGRGGRAGAHRRRPHAAAADRRGPGRGRGDRDPQGASPARGAAQPRGARDRGGRLPGSEGGGARIAACVLHRQHHAPADAAVDRPGAPLPLHLEPLAQPAGDPELQGSRADHRPRQGADRRRSPALPAHRRARPVRAAGAGHLEQPRSALPPHEHRVVRAVLRHPQREPRPRVGRRRRPAGDDRVRGARTPVRAHRPGEDPAGHGPLPPELAGGRAGSGPGQGRVRVGFHARHAAPVRDRRSRVSGPARSARASRRPRRPRRRAQHHLRDPQRGLHPPSASVRVVLELGGALRGRGERRPEGARDQDDAVPDLGRDEDPRLPARRGPQRQAGRGGGRAPGAVRRGGEHPVGEPPGGGGDPRHLRGDGSEDPLQGDPRGAPGLLRPASSTRTWAPATTTRGPRGSTTTSGC